MAIPTPTIRANGPKADRNQDENDKDLAQVMHAADGPAPTNAAISYTISDNVELTEEHRTDESASARGNSRAAQRDREQRETRLALPMPGNNRREK